MCGICGSVGVSDEGLITTMTRLMAHRGPDGEGVRCFPSIDGSQPAALGHRRLSIIDISERGAQPMSYANGRYWLTYNGELYNFRELRQGLEAEGFRFRTQTDSEVVLAMFAKHGPDMLDRLNGIFALGIWDTATQSLFLARDRLGVKPLYWMLQDKVFYFASEIKALLPALRHRRLRTDMLSSYLSLLWVPDPDTLFEGVYKLPPAHRATFSRGELSIEPYWDMEFNVESRPEREWSELVSTTVDECVQRQLVADVPVGAFLSGGLDSSAIVGSMRRARREQPVTYTVGFSSEDLQHEIMPDDVRYARQVASEFEVDYHEEVLRPSVVDLLPRLVWHTDEPIADDACITTYLVCSAARKRLTVILSGMGGDEVFAGYPRHLAARLGRIADVLPVPIRTRLRRAIESRMTVGSPGRWRAPRRNTMKLLRGLDASPLERYLTYCSYYTQRELQRLFAHDLAPLIGDPLAKHRGYAARVAGEHWLNQLLYIDLKTFLPCLNLAYTDKMSMAASTEVRVPLLDDQLVALSGRIPADLKLRRMTRKYIFKRSMEGRLPKEVIWRPKAGFGAPIRSWLVGDLKPMMRDLLSPETIRARGLFDPKEVRRLVDANESEREDNAMRLWALLTLEVWQQQYLDDPAVPRSLTGDLRTA